jgi:hypothetical protein
MRERSFTRGSTFCTAEEGRVSVIRLGRVVANSRGLGNRGQSERGLLPELGLVIRRPDESRVAHVVLRLPLTTRVQDGTLNTIEAHNEALAARGRVAIAKFGRPTASAKIAVIKSQLERGTETLLVLAIRLGAGRFLGFGSPISAVHRGPPNAELLSLAPAYYRDLDETANLWFILHARIVPHDLRGFRMRASQRPLLDVLHECRTSSMLVEASAS